MKSLAVEVEATLTSHRGCSTQEMSCDHEGIMKVVPRRCLNKRHVTRKQEKLLDHRQFMDQMKRFNTGWDINCNIEKQQEKNWRVPQRARHLKKILFVTSRITRSKMSIESCPPQLGSWLLSKPLSMRLSGQERNCTVT